MSGQSVFGLKISFIQGRLVIPTLPHAQPLTPLQPQLRFKKGIAMADCILSCLVLEVEVLESTSASIAY